MLLNQPGKQHFTSGFVTYNKHKNPGLFSKENKIVLKVLKDLMLQYLPYLKSKRDKEETTYILI